MSAVTLLEAVNLLVDLTNAATALTKQAAVVGEVLRAAHADGRDTLTDEEWAKITASDDSARERLQRAIDAAAPGAGG